MDEHWHDRWRARRLQQRFAVLDRDVDAIIRTHLMDDRMAMLREDLATALEEIGEIDLAIEWAEKAVRYDLGLQAHGATSRWERLVAEHRPEALGATVRAIFERWPSALSAARLAQVVGSEVYGDVQATLSGRVRALVRFQFETMGDVRLAWASARAGEMQDADVWERLAEAYSPIDPVAATEIQLELVYAILGKNGLQVLPGGIDRAGADATGDWGAR